MNNIIIKSLNGEWDLNAADSGKIIRATVPGCNFLDLLANKEIPDPFVGTNEKDLAFVGEKDWIYRRKFTVSKEDLCAKQINLCCDMLDTICDIYINGKKIGSGKNCHIAYSFSVKDYLVAGENEIKIIFYSPVKHVRDMYRDCPTPLNSNGQNGIVHIRKPQYHFGWDWGPVLPPSGISADIRLEFILGSIVQGLDVSQAHGENGVTVTLKANINRFDDETQCVLFIKSPDGETLENKGEQAEFLIKNPELWWTKELSGKDCQPLYTVGAKLQNGSETVSVLTKKVGLRTIELNREKDEYGSNFQFILNGVPIFIKGANYIPADSFITRFTQERLCALLDAAQFSNMNMIRVWGGGFYGSDELYDECDRRGILVWQDFCFACQAYPFFIDSFRENVLEEVRFNVRRISHHASLALWCGNNEIEDMHMAWAHMKKYVDWTEKFFYHILPDEIRRIDAQTPYTPGSPIGTAHNKDVSSDNFGDTHIWGVWHGLQPMNYYRKRFTRFCSEFGFESLPDIKTIEKFALPDERKLSSPIMKSHQKCINGNDKMIYYIASRFRLTDDIADLVYLSQVTQVDCIADATEHWRRNKGRCNGAIYWQFNDCWPVCSWSSLDYYGFYKALQYRAKWFNAPLSVSIKDEENTAQIYLINDLNESVNSKIEYEFFDFEKGAVKKESKDIKIEKLKNEELFFLELSGIDKKKTGLAVRLYVDNKMIMQKTAVFLPEKKLQLPKAKIDFTAEKGENELVINIKANSFARLIKLENDSIMPFSDNYFDLLPGEARVITQPLDKTTNQLDSLKIKSICDVKSTGTPLSDWTKRIKVYFSPTNISNSIYHRRIPD